jgi:hypothetical protein
MGQLSIISASARPRLDYGYKDYQTRLFCLSGSQILDMDRQLY